MTGLLVELTKIHNTFKKKKKKLKSTRRITLNFDLDENFYICNKQMKGDVLNVKPINWPVKFID